MAPTRDQLPDPRTSRRALLAAAGGMAGCLSNERQETASPVPETETGETPSPHPSETADTAEGESKVLDTVTGETIADGLEWLAEADGRTLSLSPGTHSIEPDNRLGKWNKHLIGLNISGATIDGQDAKLVFTDPLKGAFRFLDCSGLTLQNLQIDFDPLPFSQGTIDAFDAETGTITATLDDGYLPLTHALFEDGFWATVRDPETGNYIQDTRAESGNDLKQFTDVTPLSDRQYELTIKDWISHAGLTAGNRLVFNARQGGEGFTCFRCDDLTVQNVRIYAQSGWNEVYNSRSPTVRNLHIAPPEGSDRDLAAVGDGIHFNGCFDGPVVEDCEFEKVDDDCVAMNWDIMRIGEIPDDNTIVLDHAGRTQVEPGEDLVGISETAERLGALPAVESVERNDWKYRPKPTKIVFAESIADVLSPGDYVGNRSRANQGFVIRNNTTRNTRARPIRVVSPDGEVSGNTIDGCNGDGILLHSTIKGHFGPKGYVEDVLVKDNTITRAGRVGLTTEFMGGRGIRCNIQTRKGVTVTGQPHRNVQLVGNEIDGSAMEGIEVTNTRGVQIEDTTITDPNQMIDASYGIVMDAVNDAEISGTSVSGASEALAQFCGVRESGDVTLSGNRLSIDGEEVTPKVEERPEQTQDE